MKKLKELFELLNKEFPVSGSVRHNLTLQNAKIAEIPDDTHRARLVLSLWFPHPNGGGPWASETFILDEVDWEKTNEQLVLDIKTVLDGLAQLKAADVSTVTAEDKFQDDIRASLGY
jgi:hypothetical protein